jgi:hypothetical protein
MLTNDQTWFHPGNIDTFPNGGENVEQMIPVEDAVNGGHPPLSSPEEDRDTSKEESQFFTQAPPMMDESQVRQLQEGDTNPEHTAHKNVEASLEDEQALPVLDDEPPPFEWGSSPDSIQMKKKVLGS